MHAFDMWHLSQTHPTKFEYHEALGQSKILMKGTRWVTLVSAQCRACPKQWLRHRRAVQVQGQQQAAAQLRRQSESEQHAATSAAAIFQEGSRQARQHSEQAMQWVRCSV